MTRGLLQRLGDGRVSKDPLVDVTEHLRVLLNTQQGSSATVPDYGIPDFTDLLLSLPESMSTLQQMIRATIATYEPRLTNVVVRPAASDDPLTLRFEIVGRLASERRRLVRLETRVCSGGHVEIE